MVSLVLNEQVQHVKSTLDFVKNSRFIRYTYDSFMLIIQEQLQ